MLTQNVIQLLTVKTGGKPIASTDLAALKMSLDKAPDLEKISTLACAIVAIPEGVKGWRTGHFAAAVRDQAQHPAANARPTYDAVAMLEKVNAPLSPWPESFAGARNAMERLRSMAPELSAWPSVKAAIETADEPKTWAAAEDQVFAVWKAALAAVTATATVPAAAIKPAITTSRTASPVRTAPLPAAVVKVNRAATPAEMLATYSAMPIGPLRAAYGAKHYDVLTQAIRATSAPVSTPATRPAPVATTAGSQLPQFRSDADIAAYYQTLSGTPRAQFFQRYQREIWNAHFSPSK